MTSAEVLNDGDEVAEEFESSGVGFLRQTLVTADPLLNSLDEEHSPLLRQENDWSIGRRRDGEDLTKQGEPFRVEL